MATNIPNVTPYPHEAPQRGNRSTFITLSDSKVAHDTVIIGGPGVDGELNASIDAMNSVAEEIQQINNNVEQFESVLLSAINYAGEWSGAIGEANIPVCFSHDGFFWILTENVADITLEEPGVSVLFIKMDYETILDADQKRKITISDEEPSGGTNGDIWMQY